MTVGRQDTHGRLCVSGQKCMNVGCLVTVGRQDYTHGRPCVSGQTGMNGGCLVIVVRLVIHIRGQTGIDRRCLLTVGGQARHLE